jgi:DNA-binding SARP family transcriptional activator
VFFMNVLGASLMESTDRIEIRLLGPLHVRRADSTVVEPGAWRTGKTLDLLRLLALDAGQPVSVPSLLEKLWPDVDEAHGRASLRTAASQLRRALRSDCVERRLGGLVLRDVWVDASAFGTLAVEARSSLRERRLARVVSLTREAEALYVADFTAHDDGSGWALEARESLASVRRAMLVDAAECAIELHWMRDGVELATKALAADACSERAYRALMQAYAGLGETEQALRAFERCRQMLADELGADPSAQTRAVHMHVLAGHQDVPEALPFVGREAELSRLRGALRRSLAGEAPALVCVSGQPGTGREGLAHEAAARAGVHIARAPRTKAGRAPSLNELQEACTGSGPTVLLLPAVDSLTADDADALLLTLSRLNPQVTVTLPVSHAGAQALSEAAVRAGGEPATVVEVGPLLADDLAALASAVLSGPVMPDLVDALQREAEGLAGRSIALLRSWLSGGRIASTAKGLALAPAMNGAGGDLDVQPLVRRLLEQLTPAELEALHLTALITRPVTSSVIAPLLSDGMGDGDAAPVAPMLDRLVDHGVLSVDARGYAFRNPLVQDAVASWIRPTVRRQLHWRIAEEGHLPTEDRVRHWLEAGESNLACAAALEAASAALTQGRPHDARAHLNQMIALADGLEHSPTDQATVFETLGDTCLACGLSEEATQAFSVALSAATTVGLPSTARLAAKAEAAERGDAVPGPAGEPSPALLHITPEAGCSPDVEDALREALEDAQDIVTRVEARLRLGEIVALPRRDLTLARRLGDEATVMAETPAQAVRACMLRHLPDVLLGSGATARDALERAEQAAAQADDEEVSAALGLMRALAAHRRGGEDFAELAAAVDLGRPGPAGLEPAAVLVRAYAERGMLAEARRLATRNQPLPAPLAEQARLLSLAVLHEAEGEPDQALAALRRAIDHGVETGCLLQLPEIIARAIRLEVATDPQAAVDHFELFDWAVGGSTDQPAETCAKLLARGAVRAAREEYDRAAASAAIAAEVAEKHDAPLLAAQAHLARAAYLERSSHHNETRLAYASAARWYRAAGVDRLARRVDRTVGPQSRAS